MWRVKHYCIKMDYVLGPFKLGLYGGRFDKGGGEGN